jgi:hypothetical protein
MEPLSSSSSSSMLKFVFSSFSSEHQLVVDATILLTVQPTTAAGNAEETEEALYPARHQMTLPLHGLNVLFSDCIVAFNHHTKLDSDRSACTTTAPSQLSYL